ncbi:MAG: hypothetical protein OQK75_14255 [Gammaproteobacteria bacterium]|nr:hypothetical protein [Gammaproteobacteria bacterium]MCW8988822.1 hypothetical protein [Gammaproteobacteria bacterium]
MIHLLKQGITTAVIASLAISSMAAEREPHQVNDLRYGEALYHFYQEQYFTSITNLMVAKDRAPITSQEVDPELLLGGLYLYYGLHQDASNIFSGLIENNTAEETQDRAWFNVGKMRYQGQLYNEANKALIKVKSSLSKEREAERQNMLANTYLKQKDFSKAFEAIKQLDAHEDWQIYAKYNLGIYLIKSGKNKEGSELLKQISDLKTSDEELKALRDKTNVALGYAYIRQNYPQISTKYLQKVRLKGPLSAKALLGIGWAYQQQNKLEQALIPWMELRDWPVIDTAVQESLLAIPYTLEKMDKNQLALQHYTYAIDNYKKELTKINSAISAVKSGQLLIALRPAMVTENILATEYKNKLPGSISVPYIHHLLNDIDFQRIHKNYLDLIYLHKNLSKWKNQFSAYYLMLKERNTYYKKQQRSTSNDSRLILVTALKEKRNKLAAKINQIKQHNNFYALATEDEKEILISLDKIGRSLKHLSKNEDFSEEAEKYQLLRGLVLWEISTDYAPRFWKVKNELNQVDRALDISTKSLQSLKQSTTNAPSAFSGFDKRIKDKEIKLDNLLKKITSILSSQEKLIEKRASASLQQRYAQIKNYHTRANYSFARLYDRMTLPENSNTESTNAGVVK